LALALGGWPVLSGSEARATTLPPGFTETTIASGLSAPNGFDFAPDGRIFVCQQGGAVRVVENNTLLPTPFVTISVQSNSERGLLGVAFDPDFATNNFVYVYYTAGSGSLDPPPTPKNRVSRFTANGNVAVSGSETILLDLIPSDAGNHNAGDLAFGPDGKLYISTGDGGSTPTNSQNLTNLAGKILRINKDGTIPTDNPYFGNTQGYRQEIWCYGLRNPWRFNFQPDTGNLFIGDVGQNTWEEVDIGIAGANYGWPTAEGNSGNPNFTNPVFAYNHNGSGASITGGAFYDGTTFPTEYHGSYFYGDYVDNYIRRLTFDENGNLLADEGFATAAPSPVDIEYYGDAIWFTSNGTGTLRRITYTAGANRSPLAVAAATPIAGLSPLTVAFSSAGTMDPDGDTLTYDWDFGDGVHSAAANPSHTYAGATQNFTARLTVTDTGGLADTSAPITIYLGDQPPVATITSPANGAIYTAGQTINFSGTGTDPEDGSRPASAFTWRVVFHHADHTHPFLGPITGTTSGSFVVPDTGEAAADVFYEILLTVTDSQGVPDTDVVVINPLTASLSFQTLPRGLTITLDGQPRVTPLSVTGVVGFRRPVGVPLPQMLDGTTYSTFGEWSDGGARDHTIVTPSSDATYTALLIADNAPTRAPITGDWDGNGTTTVGLHFRLTGAFALRNSNSPGPADNQFPYGPVNIGWQPIAGDWDGNGTTTQGLFDPTQSVFYLRDSATPGAAQVVFPFGPPGAGWVPLAGDWDGNGTTTIGLYDPSTGIFYLRNSNSGGPATVVFQFGPGGNDFLPVTGDWDGDGDDTVGLYQAGPAVYHLKNTNANGAADLTFFYGPPGGGWQAVAGNWDGTDGDSIGLFDRVNGVFHLRNSNSGGAANIVFQYGPTGN
jgi:glucose/arabinose dehydrogenase